MNKFPAPSGDIVYEIVGKSEQLGDAWTLAAGAAQLVWYVEQFRRHGYTDIAISVWRGQ